MSNAQRQYEPYYDPADISGLEDLLENDAQSTESLELPESAELASIDETREVLELLGAVAALSKMSENLGKSLAAAQDRLIALQTMVALQTEKIESLPYYQAQAAKVPNLEEQVYYLARQARCLEDENAYLRQSWWKRFLSAISNR